MLAVQHGRQHHNLVLSEGQRVSALACFQSRILRESIGCELMDVDARAGCFIAKPENIFLNAVRSGMGAGEVPPNAKYRETAGLRHARSQDYKADAD